MHVLEAVDAVVLAGQRAGVHKPLPERLVEHLVDQRALARAGGAGDRHQLAQRERHVHRFEVVLPGPAHDERLAVAFSPLLGGGDRSLAGKELPGRRRLAREHVIDRSLHHHLAAVDPGSGTHLHQVVGGADGVFVVLDDDDRVADVAQALQRGDHLHVVLRVQADARLVEHVEHPHQPRADLRGQTDPLRLAAGKRARATVEVQVVQSDAQEQLEPAADLLEHLPAGVGAAAGRLDGAQERVELVEVELAELVDRLAARS